MATNTNLITRWQLMFGRRRGIICFLIVLVALVLGLCPCARAVRSLDECSRMEDDYQRLECYDEFSGRKTPSFPTKPATAKVEEKPARPPATETNKTAEAKASVLSRLWELDPASRKNTFVVRLHRSNYILPWSYNHSPNSRAALDNDRNARAQSTEAKYQISFKTKIWEDIVDRDIDLWFAYTQLSFWQVYNKAFSSPFRESVYEPELILNFRTDYDVFGLRGRIINLALDHQSNGRGQLLSRSWNRITASAGFERNNFNLLLRGWYRFPESRHEDDNRDILKYMGYGELTGTYHWKDNRFSVMLRNNLRTHENKGAIQADWSFPFPFVKKDRLSGYVQYFNGYGESLLDYNKNTNRIGVGVMLMDWN
ncbi:MAG TPA: phospholipase A [Syntrophorhabdaceae bacterium]|nr:phospholipase A [Syntrophorhabdaceae bacterium]